MERITAQIMEQLSRIEREHDVKIPYAVESGSRAWGFASPDSDYDCRFLYVHPRDWYVSLFQAKDTIEHRPDAVFDVGGWDVRKVMQHIVKSNAVMLEWLSSPVIYRCDERVRDELWKLCRLFFNPVAVGWHYLSMARSKLSSIQRENTATIKQYCYVLRPLACIRFMAIHGEIPHMAYRRNLEQIGLDRALAERIELLLREKETAEEGDRILQDPVLLDYFASECRWAEGWLASLSAQKHRDYAGADKVFRKIIEMVYEDGSN